MGMLEAKIKEFAKSQGAVAVGIAGPERLSGPPSLDASYTLPGARSVVALALPMNVAAIEAFLSKESLVPHNLDQLAGNQRIHRICRNLAHLIRSQGYRAVEVPPNNTYRRELDPFKSMQNATFSHRFGAIAAGIGAQGWSGNVKVPGHGAAVYLGSVLTDAHLESDPALPPRLFIDGQCKQCKRCAAACPSSMFEAAGEEYILLNGTLHPRGRRNNIHLCTTACFGLHALSRDKKWTTWGKHWIPEWIGGPPDPNNSRAVRRAFSRAVSTRGDSFPRYDIIRKVSSILYAEDVLERELPNYEELPEDELLQNQALSELAERNLDVRDLADPYVLTCSSCALICGPDVKETDRRYKMLVSSGLVVPNGDGRMVRVKTYEEAADLRKRHPRKVSRKQMAADAKALTLTFARYNFGFDPRSALAGILYERRRKQAVRDRITGHKDAR
ncbi:MAG: hypothetical protein AB1921_04870 [Thermodesulfobacteriota bacterium]